MPYGRFNTNTTTSAFPSEGQNYSETYVHLWVTLKPKVHKPTVCATVAAAVPLQLYQEDPVCQPLGLTL